MTIMRKINLLAGGLSLTMAFAAQADSFGFVTPPGAMAGGEPVDAFVGIDEGPDHIGISVSNLLTAGQMQDAGQLVSDVSFTLTGTTSTGSVIGSTGTFINVASDGTVTNAPIAPPPDSVGWKLSNTGSTYMLDGLAGKLSPANLIIGGTAGDPTAYSAANPSIAGNPPLNPFVQGIAHFALIIPGVTVNTKVSNVVFSFGTTPGVDVTGECGPSLACPEPATLGLIGLGLAGLGFARRRGKS